MKSTSGRKPLSPAQPVEVFLEEEARDRKKMIEIDEFRTIQDGYTVERDTLNQLIGRIQMGRAIGGLTQALNLQALKSIKASKSYKSLAGQVGTDRHGLSIPDLGTWEGFCRGLGYSPDKLDEDLKNLDAFGQEALENLSAIGAGYRDLRQYRKLPDDSKQALIEVAKSGDNEGFAELAEEIITKHVKEKDALHAQLQDAQETLEAKDRVLANKNARIDSLEEQVSRRFKPEPDSIAKTEEEQTLLKEIESAVLGLEAPLQRLYLVADNVFNRSMDGAIDLRARQALDYVCQRVVDLAQQFGVTVDLESRLRPPWMDEKLIAAMEERARANPQTHKRAL